MKTIDLFHNSRFIILTLNPSPKEREVVNYERGVIKERAPKPAILFFLAFLLFMNAAMGQYASPYSRYGLGQLQPDAFSANKAMGGITAAYISAVNINYANPASYAFLGRTTVDVGVNIDGAGLRTKDSTYHSSNSSLNHFAIAFVPYSKHNNWAISAGLLPYSNVDYNFTQTYNDPSLGLYNQVVSGSGSLYKAYVGGAYKVNGFSIGANLGYIFGKMSYYKGIALADSTSGFDTRNVTNINMKGLWYNVGIMYQKLIRHNTDVPDARTDIYAIFGAYGSSGVKLNANTVSYWDRYYYDVNGNQIIVDTVESDQSQKGKITMPFNLGAGVMFGNERFWLIGADFKYTSWSDYSSPLNNGPLANSWQAALGMQITPNITSRKYFSQVQYRLGVNYGNSEVTYQGSSLHQGAATLGLGFPFKGYAHLNLSGEFGSRSVGASASDQSAIKENFYRITFGLVLNDPNWFGKKKFD